MSLGHSSAQESASIPGELVARLEAAEAGSRELDRDIAERFGLVQPGGWFSNGMFYTRCIRGDGNSCPPLPRLTTSLDAALALAERVLASSNLTSLDIRPSVTKVVIWHPVTVLGTAKTPALALCIAILKATTASAVGASASE